MNARSMDGQIAVTRRRIGSIFHSVIDVLSNRLERNRFPEHGFVVDLIRKWKDYSNGSVVSSSVESKFLSEMMVRTIFSLPLILPV